MSDIATKEKSEAESKEMTISEKAKATIAPAPVRSEDFLAAIGASVVRQVTRTVLQQIENRVYAFEVEAPAKESLIEAPARGRGTKMAPARTIDIINLETGEKQIWIANTVFEGELDRAYPGLTYVSKQFAVRSYFPEDGTDENGRPKKRDYRVYQIIEIETDRGSYAGKSVVATGEDPVSRSGKAK